MAKEKKKHRKSKNVINKIISKRKSGKEKSVYSPDDVKKALQAVEEGMSYGKAARKFHVPKTTVYSKSKNVYPLNARKGPSTVLTLEEEERIVKWVISCGERAFPVTKRILRNNMKLLLDECERSTIFTNNLPGPKWLQLFLKRHQELSIRMAQNLTKSRAEVSEVAIRNWFNQVTKYLESKKLQDIDSSRIYNLDESAFMLCPKADLVIVRRGSKAVHKRIDGDEKESLTVLYTVSADGKLPPPMILYWYKRIPNNIAKKIPSWWSFGSTETGWMNCESFYQYIEQVFYPWLVSNNVTFPVVVYLDGHASHMSLRLSAFCSEKQIELIALFPNCTHILQPCDVSLFRPLKLAWKAAADDWRIKNAPKPLKKEDFAGVLKEATDTINFTKIMRNGFERCGLYPLNPDAVAYKKLKDSDSHKNVSPTKNQTPDFQETSCDKNQNKDFLRSFEKKLAPTLLQEFQNSHVSEERQLGLYDFWRDLKHSAGESVDKALDVNDIPVVLLDEDGFEIVLDHDLANVHEFSSNLDSVCVDDSINNRENLVCNKQIEPPQIATTSIHQKVSITTPIHDTISRENEKLTSPVIKVFSIATLENDPKTSSAVIDEYSMGTAESVKYLSPIINKCAAVSNAATGRSLSTPPSASEERQGACSFSNILEDTPINKLILAPEKNETPVAQKIPNPKAKPKILHDVIFKPTRRFLAFVDENHQPLDLSVQTSPGHNVSHTDIPIISTPCEHTSQSNTDKVNNNLEPKTTEENVIENDITSAVISRDYQQTEKKKESPFKKVFSSPKIPTKKAKTSTTKKVLTPVITSDVWRQQQLELEQEKQKKEEDKEARKQKREEEKKKKEELKKKDLKFKRKIKKNERKEKN